MDAVIENHYDPASPGYDDERTGFQLLAPHRPAVVVAASGSDDVRAAVRLAAARGEPVAVQATGHGLAGPLDGTGVLISTRRMAAVRVDPVERTAWVEAGARWRDVIDAAAPHGLAPLSGSLPGVGAVSYTLGGGVGVVARRYGFAADHVRRVDLVTADGRLREVTAESEPDLFWALRGGGGNFGVVTGMEIDLVPVDRLYGGTLAFDLGRTPELVEAWHRWTADLPDEMGSAVSLLSFPDVGWAPEPLRGRHVGQVQVAFLGPVADGDGLLAPLRALGPLVDGLREIPYSRSEVVFSEPDQPHAYRGESLLLDDVDPGRLPALVELSGPADELLCVVGLRHLGGALSRPPAVPNAVGHRSARYLLGVLSPTDAERLPAVRAVHDAVLGSWSDRAVGRSLNFTFGEIDQDGIRAAFDPEDYRRLTRVKGELDPKGLFRSNFPIPPATGD